MRNQFLKILFFFTVMLFSFTSVRAEIEDPHKIEWPFVPPPENMIDYEEKDNRQVYTNESLDLLKDYYIEMFRPNRSYLPDIYYDEDNAFPITAFSRESEEICEMTYDPILEKMCEEQGARSRTIPEAYCTQLCKLDTPSSEGGEVDDGGFIWDDPRCDPNNPTPVPPPDDDTDNTPPSGSSSQKAIRGPNSPLDYIIPIPLLPSISNGYIITSQFGETRTTVNGSTYNHMGTDFDAAKGTEIYAANNCIVDRIQDNGKEDYGKHITLRCEFEDDTIEYLWYGHLDDWVSGIKVGDFVEQGEVIGYVDSTGNSTGDHLHFEIRNSANTWDGTLGCGSPSNPCPSCMDPMTRIDVNLNPSYTDQITLNKGIANSCNSDCELYPINKERSLEYKVGGTSLVIPNVESEGNNKVASHIAKPLENLFKLAKQNGISSIVLQSAYRSYTTQSIIFQQNVDRILKENPGFSEVQAREEAARESAPPGKSEHQLGTTIDITTRECVNGSGNSNICFPKEDEFTTEHKKLFDFLENHAHEFGFAQSYSKENEDKTGYIYEPWHFRYIGIDNAKEYFEIYSQNKRFTLQEFLEEKYMSTSGSQTLAADDDLTEDLDGDGIPDWCLDPNSTPPPIDDDDISGPHIDDLNAENPIMCMFQKAADVFGYDPAYLYAIARHENGSKLLGEEQFFCPKDYDEWLRTLGNPTQMKICTGDPIQIAMASTNSAIANGHDVQGWTQMLDKTYHSAVTAHLPSIDECYSEIGIPKDFKVNRNDERFDSPVHAIGGLDGARYSRRMVGPSICAMAAEVKTILQTYYENFKGTSIPTVGSPNVLSIIGSCYYQGKGACTTGGKSCPQEYCQNGILPEYEVGKKLFDAKDYCLENGDISPTATTPAPTATTPAPTATTPAPTATTPTPTATTPTPTATTPAPTATTPAPTATTPAPTATTPAPTATTPAPTGDDQATKLNCPSGWPIETPFSITQGPWASFTHSAVEAIDMFPAGGKQHYDIHATHDGILEINPRSELISNGVKTYGEHVWIKALDNSGNLRYLSLYAHMVEILPTLKQGQKIKRGEKIGVMGATGIGGKHLHYEFRDSISSGVRVMKACIPSQPLGMVQFDGDTYIPITIPEGCFGNCTSTSIIN